MNRDRFRGHSVVFLCSRTSANFRGGEWGLVRRGGCDNSLRPKVWMEGVGVDPFRALRIHWCSHHEIPSTCHCIVFSSLQTVDQIILMLSKYQHISSGGQIPFKEGLDLRRTKLRFMWKFMAFQCFSSSILLFAKYYTVRNILILSHSQIRFRMVIWVDGWWSGSDLYHRKRIWVAYAEFYSWNVKGKDSLVELGVDVG